MPQTCSKCISWTREATTQCMNFCRTYYIRFLLLFAIWMIYDCGNVTTTKNHIMLCCLGIRIKIKRLLPSTLCLSPERNLRSKSISIYSPHIIIPIYLATCVFLLLSASNRLITVSLRHLCRKSLQKENPDLLPFCLSVIFITHTQIRSNETTIRSDIEHSRMWRWMFNIGSYLQSIGVNLYMSAVQRIVYEERARTGDKSRRVLRRIQQWMYDDV